MPTKTVSIVVLTPVFVILLVVIVDLFSLVRQRNVCHVRLGVRAAKRLMCRIVWGLIQGIIVWWRVGRRERRGALRIVSSVRVPQNASSAHQTTSPPPTAPNASSNAANPATPAPPTTPTTAHPAIPAPISTPPLESANLI